MAYFYSNSNNNDIFQSPAPRYQAQYNVDDVRFSYKPQTLRALPQRLVYQVKPLSQPSGFGAWCTGPTSKVLLCTLAGSLIAMCVIGAIVAAVITAGRDDNNQSNSTTTLGPSMGSTNPSSRPTASPSSRPTASPGSLAPGDVTNPSPSTGQVGVSGGSAPPVVSQTIPPGDNTIKPDVSSSGSVDRTLPAGVTAMGSKPAVTQGATAAVNPTGTTPKMSAGPTGTGPAVTGGATVRPNSASPGDIRVTQGATVSGAPQVTGSNSRVSETTRQQQTTGRVVSMTATSKDLTMTTELPTTRPPIVSCPTSPVMIYQRTDLNITFNRTWAEMKAGFGSTDGNYWRGLDDIGVLTRTGTFRLCVFFDSRDTGATYMADYSTFTVGDESTGYQVTVSGFGGNFTADAFKNYNGYKFMTFDRGSSSPNCAAQLGGAWWYGDTDCKCEACLTQVDFSWSLAFTQLALQRATMLLICK